MAHAIKCVYDALPRSFSARCLLISLRFSSRSFTGIRLSEVAVGTERLVSMFSTIFSAGPLIGLTSASASGAGGAATFRSGVEAVATFACLVAAVPSVSATADEALTPEEWGRHFKSEIVAS